MASSIASTSSAAGLQPRALYRSLLRELRANPNNHTASSDSSSATRCITLSPQFRSQPIVALVRSTFRSTSSSTSPSQGNGQGLDLVEMRNLETYLRSGRVHKELLTRYNPLHDQTEQERVKATARRVGLDVPVEYSPDGSEALATETASQTGASKTVGRTGPLPPPSLD